VRVRAVAANNGTMSTGLAERTAHGGLLPDYVIIHHVNYLIILVVISFSGQVLSVMLNRQLSIKARGVANALGMC
jgi:hypothetical protein